MLKVIQGDVSGAVAETEYRLTDGRIRGSVSLRGADGNFVFSESSELGIKVNASAESGTFPPGTTMSVRDIPKEQALEAAEQSIGSGENTVDAVAVDITFKNAGGEEIEPAGGKNVRVNIRLPESMSFEERGQQDAC